MRIKPKCIPCLIDVRCREAMRALGSSEKAFNLCIKVVREILRLLDETRQTTRIATELYRIVLKTVGSDPYKADKEEANRIALAILPRAESLLNRLEDRFERFRMAVRFSLVGNAIDPGVSGYKFNLSELERAVQTVKLQVDDTAAAFRLIGNGSEVLYLCDNAGEIVFDRLLVRELRRIGAHVTVAVRSEPYQNDATLEDAEASGMAEEADGLMACGEGSYLHPTILPHAALEALKRSNLVILKGMANYENLENLVEARPAGYLVLLRAKCKPIAESLNVQPGDYVAKLI